MDWTHRHVHARTHPYIDKMHWRDHEVQVQEATHEVACTVSLKKCVPRSLMTRRLGNCLGRQSGVLQRGLASLEPESVLWANISSKTLLTSLKQQSEWDGKHSGGTRKGVWKSRGDGGTWWTGMAAWEPLKSAEKTQHHANTIFSLRECEKVHRKNFTVWSTTYTASS